MKTTMAPHTPVVVSPSGNGIIKTDRRASKPLMEKRRRERINKSLNELKSILLDALRKDSTCHSKLEKADILEMTVRYLRSIQRQRISAAMALDPSVISKYRAGFVDCKAEVTKFLENSTENLHPDVKSRLMNHLGGNPNLPGHTHMMANPHAQLMTTAPPMTAAASMQPMPIQLTPNTTMHAMAAAAAAMAGNARSHGFMMGPSTPKNNQLHMESQRQHPFSTISPASSPTHHSRHFSGSTGKCSPDYNSSSPSLSPVSNHSQQQFHPQSPQFAQKGIQGSFVVIPNSASGYMHSPPAHQQRTYTSPNHRSSCGSPLSQNTMSPVPCRDLNLSSVSSVSSPRSTASSSPRKHCYPSEEAHRPFVNLPVKSEPHSPQSTDGTDPVWRPW